MPSRELFDIANAVRAAVVDAARRLLVDHVTESSDQTTVYARILTELEWAADKHA